MQANMVNNLLSMTQPLPAVNAGGVPIGGSNKGMGKSSAVANEFAALLQTSAKNSSVLPQPQMGQGKNLLQLISNLLSKNSELIDHPALKPSVQSLFGNSSNGDTQLLTKLAQTNPQTKGILNQLQQLLNSNPTLVEAVRQNPQAAAELQLQVSADPMKPIEFLPKATLADIKQSLIKPIQQNINPESLVMDQPRIPSALDQLGNRQNRKSPVADEFADPMSERKMFAKNQNNGLRHYGNEQQQFQSNIIKMPTRELEYETLPLEQSQSLNSEAGQSMAQAELANSQMARMSAMTAPALMQTPVLDLSNISASNPSELIEKITAYIEQNSVQKIDGLDLTVKHAELGQFRISVQQHADESLQMHVLTSSKAGHEFFKGHESAIVKALGEAGVQVAEFQVLASMPTRSSADQSQSFSDNRGNHSSQSQQQQGQPGNSDQRDSQRRRELWEEYRQRFSA